VEAGPKKVRTGLRCALSQPDLNIWRLALRWCSQGFGREDGEFTAKKEGSGKLRRLRQAPLPCMEKQLPQGHFSKHTAQ
jgi:hypothetical protein